MPGATDLASMLVARGEELETVGAANLAPMLVEEVDKSACACGEELETVGESDGPAWRNCTFREMEVEIRSKGEGAQYRASGFNADAVKSQFPQLRQGHFHTWSIEVCERCTGRKNLVRKHEIFKFGVHFQKRLQLRLNLGKIKTRET